MAIFKSKKTESTEKTEISKVASQKDSMIERPLLTEKASNTSMQNAYTFVVSPEATKVELAKEIEKNYKVKPVKINIINLPGKRVFVRGKAGIVSGKKKAIVFLKKGDSITL